ncbi:Plasmodium vivax Vir protein, putative [Plasmodium vivax]|uniref:Vir protein, putative n=1 Tax=Plasmodium vivax TaxID=5855 RepID=A0A1G4HDN6_PLAVI|nr:Plasmodium vivax Vir protein, putative [Plasmodium vivax]
MVLNLHDASNLQPSLGKGLNTDAEGPSSSLIEFTTPETVDNSMKNNITTTIGTVAGASSVLAFMYKFTPTGRLLNARLRRSGGRINNNLYANEESELLFDGFANTDINSYNIGYEAA